MDFSWPFWIDPIMGAVVAVAVISRCGRFGSVVVSLCPFSVWINCRFDCAGRIWIESAQSAPGNARAHRYAARARDFSDRRADLEKNPKAGRMETARSNLPLCFAYSRNADQGPDCLCVCATWNWSV